MQKMNFILLNLCLSSNFPIYIILNWNCFFNVDDSIDIMAYTGLLFVAFLFLYSFFKLEIFFLLTKYPFVFKYEAQILDKIKTNIKFKKYFLILTFIVDLFFFVLNYLFFKYNNWNFNSLILIYIFSLGGVFISYVSFLIGPWLENRFKEN